MTTAKTTTTLFLVALALILAPSALADTNLNIELSEVVFQNVSFAENFNLVEERSYAIITGTVDIDNPGATAVFDTYIRFDNVENLVTDFVYSQGRDSYQVVFPDVADNTTEYTNGTIDGTPFALEDLDEDGTNDTVYVNNTHIIFNVSSEYEVFSFPFSNSTNTSLDITDNPAVLDMNISLQSVRQDTSYNEGVLFANVTLTGTVTTPGVLELGSEVNLTVTDTARNYAIVHVPELRPGNATQLIYNISSVSVEPPLDINTTYTNPEFNTKVLAGEYFGVQLTAANVATVGDLTIVNITMEAEQVTVQNGSESETFNFTLHNLSSTGDFTWVDDSNNRSWNWFTNNGTIPIGEGYNISFQIRAPDTVATSATYLALTNYLQYTINTTASELMVTDVRSRAAVNFSETKRIVSPQDNESNFNVTWESEPSVGTAENVNFTLERVSMWVTEERDPNQRVPGLSTTYDSLNYDLNSASEWSPTSPWLFNFTDGSSEANPPPIVWVKPYWIIKNTNNQITNSSITVNGTDLYMNYIYVVNGYWLEVDKRVLDVGDGQYDIEIEVENRGNGYTPQNLTVTIYDFIPSEFSAGAWSPGPDNQSNVTGEFSGTAYQWDVGLRTNLSTSFSPRGAADGLDTFAINYSVNGTGDFSVSDLYIVGLDPRLVDGAAISNEAVAVISAIATTSREVIYLAVVVFLIGINVANFMMTSKISKKLDR